MFSKILQTSLQELGQNLLVFLCCLSVGSTRTYLVIQGWGLGLDTVGAEVTGQANPHPVLPVWAGDSSSSWACLHPSAAAVLFFS